MPSAPTRLVGDEPTLDAMRAGPREAVDDDLKDDLVIRLLRELKRQLIQLENTKPTPEIDQANIRAVNVKTLASIERSLERLLHIEQQRELRRETKVAAKNDDARAALERRLDQLLIAARAKPHPEESEQ